MLFERAKQVYEIDEIISLKTVVGDEVVGRLVSVNDGHYELNKPCIVVTSPEGIGLIQAMFGLDPDKENLVYRDQHIISMCRTHEKMRDHYIAVVNNPG
jgi:hypothetical protein